MGSEQVGVGIGRRREMGVVREDRQSDIKHEADSLLVKMNTHLDPNRQTNMEVLLSN